MLPAFTDRDLSWLSFNGRVLKEATKENVPLLERLKFLSIFSSNLDEFYRVRIPSVMALHKIEKDTDKAALLRQINDAIQQQQQLFGTTLKQEIIPSLKKHAIHFIYNEPMPETIQEVVCNYFFNKLAAYISPVKLSSDKAFFPENNKIYLIASVQEENQNELYIINIPSETLPRFFSIHQDGTEYIVFLDDIIRENIRYIFPDAVIKSVHSIKITRDAELDLQDEYEGDLAEKIEKQLLNRDLGIATRLLYDSALPEKELQHLVHILKLEHANIVAGGKYHNLKNLDSFPVKDAGLRYQEWKSFPYKIQETSLFNTILKQDILLHVPYQSYDTVLRFFNEAALHRDVEEIYITLYRIAGDSTIANALISAAKNGKKVTVFVELKARFDEANNIRWAKKMQEAGVTIIYSIPELKVHAKVALVKKRVNNTLRYFGVLATGNFNETTARFYTDHILFTAQEEMLKELDSLFAFLSKRKKPGEEDTLPLNHLLVARFNLQTKFVELIDREIANAANGKTSGITIKLNNLEEATMIEKLYEAANAGVAIDLMVRGICRLNPDFVPNGKITVKRIVDRYLEHGRIFIFHNNGNEKIWLGSSDWMERNLYRRIEVCFPLYEERLKTQIRQIVALQLSDNTQAEYISRLNTEAVPHQPIASQYETYKLIQSWQDA